MSARFLALLLLPLVASASKPIDTRFNAAYLTAKEAVTACATVGVPLTEDGYHAAVTEKLRGGAFDAPVALTFARGDATCTVTVDTRYDETSHWVRVRVPEGTKEPVGIIWRGPIAGVPQRLGRLRPTQSPWCSGLGTRKRELGMSRGRLDAVDPKVRTWLCAR